VKGFLRTYADYLGLDGNLYVDEYNNRFAQHEEPQFVPERFAGSGPRLGGSGLLRPVVVVGVIALIVAAVAAWQLAGSSGKNKQGEPPPASTQTTTTTHTTPKKPKKKHKHHVTVALPTRAVLVASRGDCWLWIRSGSASGPTVYEATLAQGKTLPVDLTNGAVWIDIGDPPSLDVRMGGNLVAGLPRQAGNVLLTRSGLKPA
jgi:hypothetical protein